MPYPFASRSTTTTPRFDEADWTVLTRLPGRVLVAALNAGAVDGAAPTAGVADGLAGLEAIAAGRASGSQLIQDVVTAIYSEQAPEVPDLALPGTDARRAVIQVLADARATVRMLGRRVCDAEARAYREWLVGIAAAAGSAPPSRRFRVDLTLALTG
jgi:hypothetical protein